jgi:hypothetical protein
LFDVYVRRWQACVRTTAESSLVRCIKPAAIHFGGVVRKLGLIHTLVAGGFVLPFGEKNND